MVLFFYMVQNARQYLKIFFLKKMYFVNQNFYIRTAYFDIIIRHVKLCVDK